MKRLTVGVLALPLALLVTHGASGNAVADTVVVKPSTVAQAGWTVVAQKGTGDTACGEFVAGFETTPAGRGSFHMYVGESARDPLPKVYLGTNRFQGIRLDRITQLKLWICPKSRGSHRGEPGQVEIAVTGKGEPCLLTYYPWDRPAYPYCGMGSWQEFDLLTSRSVWCWTNTSAADNHGNWQWVLKRFSDAEIVAPPNRDWPYGTISGCGLNIKIGAGKALDGPPNKPRWWKESSGCAAYVDKLIVGYRDNSGNEVVTTYDFEPD